MTASRAALAIQLRSFAVEVYRADSDVYPVAWIAERLQAMGENLDPAAAVPEAPRVWGTRWSNGFVTEYPDEAEARRAMTNQNEKTLVYCDVEWKEA